VTVPARIRAISAARFALESEIAELGKLHERLEVQIENSLDIFLQRSGRIVVVGLGKSGLIGRKIAATFSSTGTPSFFIHATEALHGDSGAILTGDVVLFLSNSGETAEVCILAQMLKSLEIKVLCMTGNIDSTLARICDVVLDVSVSREADPLNLAPTSSAILTLALGDAIACALMAEREFSVEDFNRRHPSGSLGIKTQSALQPRNLT
jgi:arabinose-5-phosphate isomerase